MKELVDTPEGKIGEFDPLLPQFKVAHFISNVVSISLQ
jgi:hypothetical protein